MRLVSVLLFFLPFFLPATTACTEGEGRSKKEKGTPMSGEKQIDYEKIFRNEFDDPVVEMGPSLIRGVHTGTAFDRSDLAEDPFTPTCWIVTEDGNKEIHSTETLRAALERVGFEPGSEGEALHAARLNFMGDERILKESPSSMVLPGTVPVSVAEKVRAPVVRKREDHYEVVLFTYFYDSVMAWFREPAGEQVSRYVFRVGKGRYEVSSETLWSRTGM